MSDKKIIKVTLFGSEYALRTDANEEYVQEIVQFINSMMLRINSKNSNLPSYKMAILCLIEVVDELLRLKQDMRAMENEVGDKATDLIKKIEEKLSNSYTFVE